MTEKTIRAELLPYVGLVKGLGELLGKDCEVLLHDVSAPEASIVACANAEVSGRGVGSPMTDFSFVLLHDPKYKKMDGVYNYSGRTKDGRQLKCGVHFIKDAAGEIVGFLCINMDVSKITAARAVLDEFFKIDAPSQGEPFREHFAQEIDDVVEDSIAGMKKRWGSDLSALSRVNRIRVVEALDEAGFFLVKGAMERLSAELKKSKFTIYGYLREAHSDRRTIL